MNAFTERDPFPAPPLSRGRYHPEVSGVVADIRSGGAEMRNKDFLSLGSIHGRTATAYGRSSAQGRQHVPGGQ